MLAWVILVAWIGPVAAQELCVVCREPDVTYRCVPRGATSDDPRVPLACLSEIAKSGAHADCSVSRRNRPCDGVLREITLHGDPLVPLAVRQPPPVSPPVSPPLAPLAPGQGGLANEDQGQGAPRPDEPDKTNAPPRTVEELASRTAKSAQEQLSKTTGAVTNVAKKTGEVVGDAADTAGDAVKDVAKSAGSLAKKSWNCLTSLFNDC